ncbi:MAG: hypothetical protein VB084_07935 [Syntrophomonadaceae bacterium]|nr:hypothetical protein [Syntrophomonadaceae bacterium]
MPRFNTLIIPARKLICPQNILGIIVCYTEQSAVLPLLSFFFLNLLGDLNI